jgi:predicted amidohydrolase
LRIACAQLGPAIGQVAANRERAAEAIDDAAASGARLVVLPELCITGYCFADADEARGCAEPLDGPTVRGWCEQAAHHDLVVVGGICELDPDGALRNSAVIVDASGVRAAYRKSHLWDREPAIFRRGDEPAPVVDTAAGRIGVAVCYDAVFPEHLRRLGLAGAEIVAVPMASPAPAQPTEPIAIEIALAMAAANSNRVYVAQADRTRDERGTRWAQASVIVDPDGSVVAGPADGEALLLADADLARARDKSWGERNDVLGDRRPELYTTTDHDPGDRLR